MTDLKRDIIKYIRDRSKAKYPPKVECRICLSKDQLQLHHYNSMTLLLKKWLGKKEINSVDEILEVRDSFILEHDSEIFKEVVCLCKNCHTNKLHKIYGKVPSLSTSSKQPVWVEKMRDKHNAMAKN